MALSKQMKLPFRLTSRGNHCFTNTSWSTSNVSQQRQHFEQARPLQSIDDATKLIMRGDK